MSRIHVIKPGMMTTVQDLGRLGWQRHGVTPGGAVDAWALRLANLLAGNPEGAAGLEITGSGPTLQFDERALVAISGADFEVSVDGVRVPPWRPVWLEAGAGLVIGAARTGCRGYLAVAGGLAVPRVLGGRGTHLAAGFGGFEGRALRAGDMLKIGPASTWAKRLSLALAGGHAFAAARWEVGAVARPKPAPVPVVRVVRGPQWDWFSAEAQARLLGERFTVDPRSDRMGLRLRGNRPGLLEAPLQEMVSEGVVNGTVQVPPDGWPIVLLADRQTVGGYPKIAVVVRVDLPLLAQLRAGDTVGFNEVSLAEAQELYLANERLLATVKQGIALHVA
jgi:antagonist of KipI